MNLSSPTTAALPPRPKPLCLSVVPALCPLPHRPFLLWGISPVPVLPSQAAKSDLNQRSSCLPALFFPFLSIPGSYSSWNGCCQLADAPSGLGQELGTSSSSCQWGFSFHFPSWQEPHSRQPHLWRTPWDVWAVLAAITVISHCPQEKII